MCFGFAIALTFLYSSLVCAAHLPEICWYQLKVALISGKPLILTYVLLTIPIVSASLVITILLVKVWRKLRIMAKRPIGGRSNKTFLAASKYVIWTCFAPTFECVIGNYCNASVIKLFNFQIHYRDGWCISHKFL